MRLSRAQIETAIADQSFKLALIGMSNIGKSHWSAYIANQFGFRHVEIDSQIQRNLELSSIKDTALWMGQPYTPDYNKRAETYLALENKALIEALDKSGNMVLDTTGSIVHLGQAPLERLQTDTLIVYLQTDRAGIDTLIERFSRVPKPLIWGEFYKTENPDDPQDGLIESYVELLNARARLYHELADITLPVSTLTHAFTPEHILQTLSPPF